MTRDLQWLLFAATGAVALFLALRAVTRRRAPAAKPPHLAADPTRVVLIVGLPFAFRLLQVGGADVSPGAFPAVTLPLAAWSVWLVALLLLAVPVVLWWWRRSGGFLPAALLAVSFAAVLAMGAADSPFDRPRLEEALRRHEAFCRGLASDVPEQHAEIRAAAEEAIAAELAAARAKATEVFELRGTTPAVALLDARRPDLELRALEWRRRVETRERELAEQRRRERQAQEERYSYYSENASAAAEWKYRRRD